MWEEPLWEEPLCGRSFCVEGASVWEEPLCGRSFELNLILGSVSGLLTTEDALIIQIQIR